MGRNGPGDAHAPGGRLRVGKTPRRAPPQRPEPPPEPDLEGWLEGVAVDALAGGLADAHTVQRVARSVHMALRARGLSGSVEARMRGTAVEVVVRLAAPGPTVREVVLSLG